MKPPSLSPEDFAHVLSRILPEDAPFHSSQVRLPSYDKLHEAIYAYCLSEIPGFSRLVEEATEETISTVAIKHLGKDVVGVMTWLLATAETEASWKAFVQEARRASQRMKT